MKIGDAFQSNYLRATDIKKPVTVTIKHCNMEEVGQGSDVQEKLVLGFEGKKKGMVLNKTNAFSLAGFFGEETNDWIGKEIELFTMMVQGPNGMVSGIRVRLPATAQAVASDDFDDDIPF